MLSFKICIVFFFSYDLNLTLSGIMFVSQDKQNNKTKFSINLSKRKINEVRHQVELFFRQLDPQEYARLFQGITGTRSLLLALTDGAAAKNQTQIRQREGSILSRCKF